MTLDQATADLNVSLPLDVHAPRAARHHVMGVDRPSPDLRDVVVLLTSELVSLAVDGCRSPGARIELMVWMPSDVVRVEIRAPLKVLRSVRPLDETDYELLLVRRLADRWAEETQEGQAHVWFEIDRQSAPLTSVGAASSIS